MVLSRSAALERLGLAGQAAPPAATIKRAFHALALQWCGLHACMLNVYDRRHPTPLSNLCTCSHPDKRGGDGDDQMFKELAEVQKIRLHAWLGAP